jgi:DNA repair exonuclease SbcCD ATPase subunit
MTGGLVASVYIPDFSLPGTGRSAPCEQPLTYQIGEIDDRYDITQKELASVMKEVEDLWFTAMDKDLLNYSEDGKVVVNLVYGEEQERSEREKKLSNRIEIKKEQRKVTEEEYKRISRVFKSKREDLEELQSQNKQEVTKYNNYVTKWNGKSDVPEQVKREIKQMKRELEKVQAELQQKQDELEFHRQQANSKGKQLNKLIEEEKELVASYNNRFAKARKFNQGQFVKQGENENVYIYQFSDKHDLKTVLAHEFGHAMGLEHVSNPESIMHEMMDEQNIFDLSLTSEDINAIKSRCTE